jgi:Na+-transporting methylmalonyl-CoA/oxaloacetate decarboxylase beta subunit
MSSPSTCKVNAWSYTFILPYASIVWCLGTTIVSALRITQTRKIKKREEEEVVRVTKFITGNVIEIIWVLKVSRWCPLVLVVNVC